MPEKEEEKKEPLEEVSEEEVLEKEPLEEVLEKDILIDQERLKKLEEGCKLADEYLDHLKRLKAEFENYKKRTLKEREELIKYANEDLISQLLPIIDNFERALLSEYEKHNLSFFKEGILLIKKQFSDLLSERGLKEMDPLGKALDSNLHHALMQKSSEEYEENIIIEELQKGYLLYDKVIRPSQVVVSSGRNSGEGKKKEEE